MKEQWRDIPGYGGRYQISSRGRVRSMYLGDALRRKPYMKKLSRRKDGSYVVNLLDANGKLCTHTATRLMAITFLGLPPDSKYRAYCKNGMKSDLSLENIGICDYNTLLRGGIRNRPVRKVYRETGEIVEVYRSVKEAAVRNYMTETGMHDRLKGRKKRPEEYIFEYDE